MNSSSNNVVVQYIYALIKSIRTSHWIKNIIVFAAPLFALELSVGVLTNAFQTFVAFCLISSSFYLINDILDREKDREHPVKKVRPIASGQLPLPIAYPAFGILLVASLLIGWYVNINVLMVLIMYGVLQVLYNAALKKMVVMDLLVIAAGFILRAVSGAFAAGVPASNWFLVCVGFLAFFLGIEKRKAELYAREGNATRSLLGKYTTEWLNRMESAITAGIIITYALWTIEESQSELMLLTIPFVMYAVFKYPYYAGKGKGENPEIIMWKEPSIMVTVLLWAVVSYLILYYTS